MTSQYQRLYRQQANYRWWRPLIALLLAGVIYVSLASLIGAVTYAIVLANSTSPAEAQGTMTSLFTPDTANPLSVLLALVTVGIGLPVIFLSMWAVGLKPVGMLHSVTLRVRWRRLASYLVIAVAAFLAAQLLSIGLSFVFGNTTEKPQEINSLAALVSMLIVLAFVPLQIAAEEYAFRGMLLQSLGAWIKYPVIPILISAALFTLGHAYEFWGMTEVFVLGVVAAWLTSRTGGLEAALALHLVNNLGVFMLLASGLLGTTAVTENAGSPLSLAVSVLMLTAFSWFVIRNNNKQEQESVVGVNSNE